MSHIPRFEGVSKVCPRDHLWPSEGFCLASDHNSRDRFGFFLVFLFYFPYLHFNPYDVLNATQ